MMFVWKKLPQHSLSEIQYVMDLRAKLHTSGRLSAEFAAGSRQTKAAVQQGNAAATIHAGGEGACVTSNV